MKLSDQIALLRETLEEFGYRLGDGQSVGEGVDQVIRHLEEFARGQDFASESGHIYPHMCRDGHREVGWSGDDERCPVCEAEDAEAQALSARIVELEAQIIDAPSTDGLCDSCRYMKDGNLPRLCHNNEAFRQGFSRRGYSVKAGHGCEEWR